MPNKLSTDKVRISYAEDVEVRRALERLAKQRDVPLSDLVKEATGEYLAKRTPHAPAAKPDKGSGKSPGKKSSKSSRAR